MIGRTVLNQPCLKRRTAFLGRRVASTPCDGLGRPSYEAPQHDDLTPSRLAMFGVRQVASQEIQRFDGVSERLLRLRAGASDSRMTQRLNLAGRLKCVLRIQSQH